MKIFEVTKKSASFALGRLNPATIGHELLVNAIKKAPGDSFLFLTDRAPKLPTDPLSAEEKLDWARKSFDGIAIGLAKTVLTAADRLYKMGYKEVTFLEGEPKLLKILQDYNGVEKPLHNYNFDKISYMQLARDPEASGATGMSASKLRQTVMDNDLEAFKQGVTKAAQPHAENMFKNLQGLMGVDPVDDTDIQETELKDFYGDAIVDQKVLDHPNWHPDLAPFFKPDPFSIRRAIKKAQMRLRNDRKKNKLNEKLYSRLYANEGILDIFFGDQEESLSNNPYYKAWKKMYLKNPDIAALNKRHKEFLAYYNKIEGNKKDA